jgi:hypothetical protein
LQDISNSLAKPQQGSDMVIKNIKHSNFTILSQNLLHIE